MGLFAALLFQLMACQSPEAANAPETLRRPNVLLIMTDDQGYGDLGCNGNPLIRTPHLDQLQKESVVFSNFHVGTTCAPTRAGLLSGVHCNRTGTWHTVNGRSFLSTRFPSLASLLKKGGYRSGIFGKWHLGDNFPYRPQDRGFDEVLIHGGGGIGQTPDAWNNDYFNDTYFHNGRPQKYNGYCTDIWFAEALKFMKTCSADGQQPFFCYISTNAPHGPHHVPQSYIDLYKEDARVPNPNFYGQITNIDDNFGQLEQQLRDWEILDNTILIFLTDNGTAQGVSFGKEGEVLKGFNASMRGTKGSEYEGGHRVPLFIKFPERLNISPRSFGELTSYTDLAPTLLDLLDIQADTKTSFDGLSLKPLITQGQQDKLKDRLLIVDTQRNAFPKKWKNSSVMQNKWRLVNNRELYDLSQDPGQQVNLIEQHPEVAQRLSEGYESWWADLQADLKMENRIIVGHEEENPTLLTSHDWYSEQDPPWHQRHIRSGKADNGSWRLEIETEGPYHIRLHRWPPSIRQTFIAPVAAGQEIDGGVPYEPGVSLDANRAQIEIQDQQLETTHLVEDAFFEFSIELKKGKADLQSWIYYDDEQVRGAYYVEIIKSEAW
ncbi:MAG: arylsulfatase [Bacteroidota bacterium]